MLDTVGFFLLTRVVRLAVSSVVVVAASLFLFLPRLVVIGLSCACERRAKLIASVLAVRLYPKLNGKLAWKFTIRTNVLTSFSMLLLPLALLLLLPLRLLLAGTAFAVVRRGNGCRWELPAGACAPSPVCLSLSLPAVASRGSSSARQRMRLSP